MFSRVASGAYGSERIAPALPPHYEPDVLNEVDEDDEEEDDDERGREEEEEDDEEEQDDAAEGLDDGAAAAAGAAAGAAAVAVVPGVGSYYDAVQSGRAGSAGASAEASPLRGASPAGSTGSRDGAKTLSGGRQCK